MLMIITRWLIITVAILLASKFVPGIHVFWDSSMSLSGRFLSC